jgi:PAS domain S-box-containing protein
VIVQPSHAGKAASADLFDLAPCAMVVCDRQGGVRRFNRAFARLVGWSDGAPPQGKFSDLLTRPSQYIFASQVLPPLQLAGAVQEIELDIVGSADVSHAVLLSGVQLDDADAGWLHYFSLTATKARRVYEREQLAARGQLDRKQEYLNLAEKLARVGHWHVDLTQRTSFWSPEIYAIHGLDPRMTGPSFEEIMARYHDDDREAVRDIIGGAIVDHEPFWFQKRLAATAGRGERMVEASGLVEVGPDGQATGVFGVLRDVTDAVKAQHDLETSEERYRLLADNVPGMIGYWDSDMVCRFANRAYLEWFGRSPEALIGRTMRQVLGEALYALNKPYIEGVLAGVDQAFERAIVKPSGETGDTWANYVPDLDAEGKVRGFYALVTDITELKQRNLAELASNALQSAVLSSTNFIVIATTPQGVVTVFNKAAETALGYAAGEVIGKQTPALWHDRDEVIERTQEVNRVLAEPIEPGFATFLALPDRNGMVARDWTFIRKDGSRFPVRLNGSRIMDASGKVTGYLGVAEDITERRNAEMALRSSEETFRAAMENASIGMTIMEPPGRWLRVNRALTQLLGYSQEELLQLNFRAITHPDDLDQSDLVVERLLAGEAETSTIEKRYVHKTGRIVWAQLNISAVRHPDGRPQYLIAQVQDITERREVERVKNALISTVSHELRTPVTSIRGALGLLAGSMSAALPADVAKLIGIANKNSERLNLLVNDMLDIEKIASGKMQFHVSRCDLDGLVAAAIEDNAPYAERFGVSMVTRGGSAGLHVRVDAARFQQVMSNLLSNAAKFSPPGGQVEVRISAADTLCRIAITDHGQGISPAFAPHVFAKFSQADSSATRSRSGSGLGLHISREIIEQMGGAIGFDSPSHQGATFWVELPRG